MPDPQKATIVEGAMFSSPFVRYYFDTEDDRILEILKEHCETVNVTKTIHINIAEIKITDLN